MFHISTGLDGEQKKYTKKYTAESIANTLKLEELTEKLTVFSEIKLQFPRFLDVKYYERLLFKLITHYLFFPPEAITFCSGGKR